MSLATDNNIAHAECDREGCTRWATLTLRDSVADYSKMTPAPAQAFLKERGWFFAKRRCYCPDHVVYGMAFEDGFDAGVQSVSTKPPLVNSM